MKTTRSIVCILLVSVLATGAVLAQEEASFKTTLSAGLSLTDGNSDTMQANASLLTEGEKARLGSLRAGIEGNYGESEVNDESETTVENARAFANVKKTITEKTFGSVDGSVLYDDIAAIDYRVVLGPALGAYLVKDERTALSVEAGPSYVWEKVNGETDDYLALRFSERCDHKLSDTAKVWQSVEYLPRADDFQDYLLNGELGVEAALNATLNLRLVIQDKYDSTPGEGLERNDVTLIAGISMAL